jgi:DNA invertase Pin-like site-specific DNA recombinase
VVCSSLRRSPSSQRLNSKPLRRQTVEKKVAAPKRRTRAEVQQLVTEFVSSGMRRSEFCRNRGLSFGTLSRHLKKQHWKRKSRKASSAGRLVPWSWPPRNRRGSTNRVAGWPWSCRAGAGSK